MKFILFVEGQTEKDSIAGFIKRWIDPKFTQGIRISVIGFRGFGEYLAEIKSRTELYLTGKHKDDIIAAVGLLDLYGPAIFPSDLSFTKRAAWGKNDIERRVGQPKFRQYFAVHETEAWFLAHKEILPEGVRKALPNRCEQPETVNSNEPPSKLLGRLYRDRVNRDYRKTIDGRNLFLKCNPMIVAERCPHFAQLLTDMENLAREAGVR